MNVSSSEALDIFKKWHGEKTRLRCQIVLRTVKVACTAVVFSVSESELMLTSDDLRTELIVPLTHDQKFAYADARDAPEKASC